MSEVEALNQEQPNEPEEPAQEAGFLLDEQLYGNPETEEVEEVEAEETTEAEPDEEPSEGEENEEIVKSFSDLVESQGWDPEWANSLELDVKVDGTPAKATLKDLVDSYQMREAAAHRLEEAKSKKASLDQEMSEQREAIKAEYGTALGLVQLAEQLFSQESQDLAKLKEEDPQQYLVAKDQFNERRQALEQVKTHLRNQLQQTLKQSQPKPSEETYAEARQKLVEQHPELGEPDKRAELGQYVIKSAGFSADEVAAQTDPRLFSLAYKAMLYDRSQEKVATAKKKVTKIPKAMKPGATNKPTEEKPKDAASILYGNS